MTNYETLYGGLKQPEDFEDKDWFKPVKGINKITFKSEFSEPKEKNTDIMQDCVKIPNIMFIQEDLYLVSLNSN